MWKNLKRGTKGKKKSVILTFLQKMREISEFLLGLPKDYAVVSNDIIAHMCTKNLPIYF